MADEPNAWSSCSCAMPPEMFGMGGWHFVKADVTLLKRHMRALYEAKRTKVSLRTGAPLVGKTWEEWETEEKLAGRMDESGFHVSWKPYLGSDFAIEPCPAYRRAYGEWLARQQAKNVAEKKSKVYGEQRELPEERQRYP